MHAVVAGGIDSLVVSWPASLHLIVARTCANLLPLATALIREGRRVLMTRQPARSLRGWGESPTLSRLRARSRGCWGLARDGASFVTSRGQRGANRLRVPARNRNHPE